MIRSKRELKYCLNMERKYYIKSKYDYIKQTITRNEKKSIWNFQKHLRKAEYCFNSKSVLKKIAFVYHIIRKNIIGKKLGIFIQINTVDIGLTIYHSGIIIVSGIAKCGKNLKLHGCNCIGNKGIDGDAPIIGDNCDIGFGAVVIGKIVLGNDIKIGANAVVNKSFEGGVLVGMPAKCI